MLRDDLVTTKFNGTVDKSARFSLTDKSIGSSSRLDIVKDKSNGIGHRGSVNFFLGVDVHTSLKEILNDRSSVRLGVFAKS